MRTGSTLVASKLMLRPYLLSEAIFRKISEIRKQFFKKGDSQFHILCQAETFVHKRILALQIRSKNVWFLKSDHYLKL